MNKPLICIKQLWLYIILGAGYWRRGWGSGARGTQAQECHQRCAVRN